MRRPLAAALALLLLPALLRAQVVAPAALRATPVAAPLPAPVLPALAPAGSLAPTLGAAALSNLSLPAVPMRAPFSARVAPAAPMSAMPAPASAAGRTASGASSAQGHVAPAEAHAAAALGAVREQSAPADAVVSVLKGASAELAPARSARDSDEAAADRARRAFDASRAVPEGAPVVAADRRGVSRTQEPGRLHPARRTPDDAVPWAEIERVVAFASPAEARRFEKGMEGEFRPHRPGESVGWQDFLRAAFDLMQTAPEGREVLRQLVDEYARTGKKVTIMPEDFADSTLFRDGEMEDINGTHGMVVPELHAYYFNSKYLEFADRDLALQYVAANIAHEFRHLVNQAQVERITPEAAEAFSLAFINEQRARQTGYLVAVRTNKGKATGSTEDARSLAQDPESYWEGLKIGGYAQFLDMDEMADPVNAFIMRIAALQEEAAGLREQFTRRLPRLRMALDILATKEGRAGELEDLRREVGLMTKIFPEEHKELRGTIKALQRMLAGLRSPEARRSLRYLRAAAQSPAFQKLYADYRRDQAALVKLLREKPIPAHSKTEGQLDLEEARALILRSQHEHPEYWTAFKERFGEDKRTAPMRSRSWVLRPSRHRAQGLMRAADVGRKLSP